jgi:hypothetical protein
MRGPAFFARTTTNREAHQIAHELSNNKLTGESMTTAVTIALRERLERFVRTRA